MAKLSLITDSYCSLVGSNFWWVSWPGVFLFSTIVWFLGNHVVNSERHLIPPFCLILGWWQFLVATLVEVELVGLMLG